MAGACNIWELCPSSADWLPEIITGNWASLQQTVCDEVIAATEAVFEVFKKIPCEWALADHVSINISSLGGIYACAIVWTRVYEQLNMTNIPRYNKCAKSFLCLCVCVTTNAMQKLLTIFQQKILAYLRYFKTFEILTKR